MISPKISQIRRPQANVHNNFTNMPTEDEDPFEPRISRLVGSHWHQRGGHQRDDHERNQRDSNLAKRNEESRILGVIVGDTAEAVEFAAKNILAHPDLRQENKNHIDPEPEPEAFGTIVWRQILDKKPIPGKA